MRQSPLIMYRLTWILGNLACESANTVRSIFKNDLWSRTITVGIKTCEYTRTYSADYTMFFILTWANNIILKRMKTVCVELSVADVDALNNFARVMIAAYGKDESKKKQLTAMVYFLSCVPDDYFRDVIFGDSHIIEQTLKMGQSELRKYYQSIECDSFDTSIAINNMCQPIFLAIWRMLVNLYSGANRISRHAIRCGGLDYISIMIGHSETYARKDAWLSVANICASGSKMIDSILNNKKIMSKLCFVLGNDKYKVKTEAMDAVFNAIQFGSTSQIFHFFCMNGLGCIAAFMNRQETSTKNFIKRLLICLETIVCAMGYSDRENWLLKELDTFDLMDKIEALMMEMGHILPESIWHKFGEIQDKIDSMRSVNGCELNLICASKDKSNEQFHFGIVEKTNVHFDF